MDNAQALSALFGSDDDETDAENQAVDLWDSADESPAIVLESRLVDAAARIGKGEPKMTVCRELGVSRNTVNR